MTQHLMEAQCDETAHRASSASEARVVCTSAGQSGVRKEGSHPNVSVHFIFSTLFQRITDPLIDFLDFGKHSFTFQVSDGSSN